MNSFKNLTILCAIFFLLNLSGCNTPALVNKVDEDTQKNALNFQPNPQFARVYFVTGKIMGTMFNNNHSYPADIFVNTTQIGSINKDNVLYFQLKPGNYDFSWAVRNTNLIVKQTVPQKTNFDIFAGQVLVLRGDYNQGGSVFGLLGAMIAPPTSVITVADRDEASKKQVVTPQTCDPSLCPK